MKVLLIEADGAHAQTTELILKGEGFNVYTTDLGEEGVDLAKVYDYQAILLADGLADMRGLDVVRQLRAASVATPILMLCTSDRLDDKLAAFRVGADDCLSKPFHRDELVARLHALIRRSVGVATAVLTIGPISVDVAAKLVSVDGASIHLTGKEYGIIEFLALRKGAAQTKEAIMNQLYGGMDEPELKIIDVFICKVRSKLRRYGVAAHLQTAWGRGYLLSDAPSRDAVKRQPAAHKGVPIGDAVLAELASGNKSFRQLVAALSIWSEASVRASVCRLMADGRVQNLGRPLSALYALRRRASAA